MTVVLVSYGVTEQAARDFLPPAVMLCQGRCGRTYRIYLGVDHLPSYHYPDGTPIVTSHSFASFELAQRWVEQQNAELES
jgi:hypothetical protein